MRNKNSSAGGSGMVSRKGTGGEASARTGKEEDNSLARAARIALSGSGTGMIRKTAVIEMPAPARTQTTVIIHEKKKGGISVKDMYVKTRGIVQRAMDLLESWKYQPASIRASKLPVDIVALRDDMDMLVQVISSKHPIPDARTLIQRYAKKIDALRLMGTAKRFRKILMAHSLPCGWRHYDVLPGGLIPAWDLHKLSPA
jgi:hypothetical protein